MFSKRYPSFTSRNNNRNNAASDPFADSSISDSESLLLPPSQCTQSTQSTSTQSTFTQPPRRKSKRVLMRELARAVVHPRKTRMAKRQVRAERERELEVERIRNINDFLESGRGGPRWGG